MNIIKVRSELNKGKTIYDLELNVGYYARVSTDKSDQLNSLENQEKYFREMIGENKSWHLVGEYIDEGISGTQVKKRDNFLKMINDAKNGLIDLIITKEISRFSRNVIDSIKYTEELLNNGCVVYFLSDNINTIYPDSEFRLTLMSSLAQDEVRKLSERVKFGIKRMIKDGKIIGSSLTGYYRKNGQLIVNENEKEIIEILFNLYATGKYSFSYISNILEDKGYLSKTGKKYSITTLKKMLQNPRYKGYYTANLSYIESYKTHKKVKIPEKERIIYKDANIPAIVSEELWNRANEIYQQKKSIISNNNLNKQKLLNSKYSGKIRCRDHAYYIRKNKYYWVCSKHLKEGICNMPMIKEKVLDSYLLSILIKRIDTKEIEKDLINKYIDIINKNSVANINNINNKKLELNRNKDKLIELNLNNIISNEELKLRLNKIEKELNNLKIDSINNDRLIIIKNNIHKLIDIKNNLDMYINLLINKIIVQKENKLEIAFKDNSQEIIILEN